ncbi:MAG TPA: polyphosphate kinase 1 [Prolixibacteraceae bacterium]|nr:polyphosphate kinase 1 [Prolixibacteraceae bacterium]
MEKMSIYNNREISWLSFNARVLQEAEDQTVPLLERIRFLGIFSNNLDEFFRVRVATVRRMLEIGKDDENILGDYNAAELYEKIQETVVEHQRKAQEIYRNIWKEMASENIFVLDEKALSHEQGIYVRKYFNMKVLPNIVPIMLSKSMKFPYLRDKSVYLAVKLSKTNSPDKFAYALIRVPSRSVSRFLVLPEQGNKKYIILVDDVIRFCLNDVFPIFNFDHFEAYTIKVTRDAEMDIDDDISKSFIEKIELSLKKRKVGIPVRLIYDHEMPDDLLEFIMKKMKLDGAEKTVAGGRYHNHKDFMNFPEIGKPNHYYQSLPPIPHKDLTPHQSILKKLRQKDVLLHYPYQSFSHFIDFLREAAIDPKVREIGITIYRVSETSKVVNALLNAIRNGKKVTVVIELQARFDEEANIFWSNKLQEEGAHVINGIPGLKVHCKLAWIQRKEKNGLRNYAYIGTGNFHEGTARVYADKGLLTADPQIANDVANMFDFFKHTYNHFNFNRIIVSPFSMRNFFIKKIDQEITNAKKGKKAYMILKMNSLIDKEMIDKLYEASQAGVKIQLIIRGIFGLKTDYPILNQNIEAISIVDKFLEHTRVFLFANGGQEDIYISSADWMSRNLDRRIEVACPIYSPEIRSELKELLRIQLSDNTKARILDSELSNRYNNQHNESHYRAQVDYHNYIKKRHQNNMKFYHNPRCSKSREGLKFLEEKGFEVEVIDYMKTGITIKEITEFLSKSGLKATDIIRTTEVLYKEQFLGKEYTETEWIGILAENPKLIQRPLVIKGSHAVLARPAEEILKLI